MAQYSRVMEPIVIDKQALHVDGDWSVTVSKIGVTLTVVEADEKWQHI